MVDPTCVDPLGTVKLVASIASPIVSAFIAWTGINMPQKDRESKNHLDQAILSLQRPHAVLTDDGKSERAKPDRLSWLTAARHIETDKVLKDGVTEPSHKVPCEGPRGVLAPSHPTRDRHAQHLPAGLARRRPCYQEVRAVPAVPPGRLRVRLAAGQY